MSISRLTVLACVASLTMSFSALIGQCPAKAQQAECCQKASSKAQPPVQEPTKQEQAANKKAKASKDCCAAQSAKKAECCAEKSLLTDGPKQAGSKVKAAAKKVVVTAVVQAGGQLNATCPLSKKAVTSESPLLAYNGFAVRVCCKGCVGKFTKLSTRKKDAYIASLVAPSNKSCPFSNCEVPADAPSVTYMGNTVKLCCDDCLDSWGKADSKKRALIVRELRSPSAKKGVESCGDKSEKSSKDSVETSIETSVKPSGKKGPSESCCNESKAKGSKAVSK